MIITHLKGGLGNQMFQYACGYALAKEYNTQHKIDLSFYENIPSNNTKREFELSLFNISYELAKKSEIEKVKNPINNLTSRFYNIFTGIYPIEKYLGFRDIYLDGYFQSEKIFIKYREEILKEFTLKKECKTEQYLKVENDIRNKDNTISMHIRRGDYVTDLKTSKHHGVLGIDYYKKSLKMLKVKNPYLFVFSDDINWVKKNFKFLPKDTYFVSKHKFNSAQEIVLMSLCKDNIIANSSFSWWGAWLNQNKDKKVIAPKRWTRSVLAVNPSIAPNNWERI